MIDMGVKIVESVNCSVFLDLVPFVVVGDRDCVEVKSFWFNTLIVGISFSYVSPKKTLKLTSGTTLAKQSMRKC